MKVIALLRMHYREGAINGTFRTVITINVLLQFPSYNFHLIDVNNSMSSFSLLVIISLTFDVLPTIFNSNCIRYIRISLFFRIINRNRFMKMIRLSISRFISFLPKKENVSVFCVLFYLQQMIRKQHSHFQPVSNMNTYFALVV